MGCGLDDMSRKWLDQTRFQESIIAPIRTMVGVLATEKETIGLAAARVLMMGIEILMRRTKR